MNRYKPCLLAYPSLGKVRILRQDKMVFYIMTLL